MSATLNQQKYFNVQHCSISAFDAGMALRKIRSKHGYSQQHIANCLEISRVAYFDWESNKVNLTLKNLSRVCQIYNIKLSAFIVEYME